MESYFHICYITGEQDEDKVARDYNLLSDRHLFKVASDLKKLYNNLSPEDEEFVKKYLGDKVSNAPSYLHNIRELADKTNNTHYYNYQYSHFSSYIHYSRSTVDVYSKDKEDESLAESIFATTDMFISMFFKKVMNFLKVESELYSELLDKKTDIHKMRELNSNK